MAGVIVEVMAGQVQVHRRLLRVRVDQIDLRRLTGRICSDSRYLATVRRATTMPCWPRISEIWLSDSGLREFSALDELLDQRADRGARSGAAGFGGDVAAEEVLELEDAARREHELLRGHARDGRFVQVERVGDLAQHQRPHRDFAVLEEMPLAVDDRLRHAQDRVEALLHVLDQPLRFLQLARELLRAGVAVARAGCRRRCG